MITVFLASVAGVWYGHRLHAHGVTLTGHLRVRDAPLIPLCLLGFIGLFAASNFLMSRPGIAWDLPLLMEYTLLPSLWALKLALVAFTGATVATLPLVQKQQGRIPLLVACIAVVVSVEAVARYTHQPHLPELHDWERDGVIIQSSGVTCAPAACANIARHLGVEMTEREMAEVLQTNWLGTSPSQMVYGMRSLGFSARKVTIPTRDIRQVTPPAILSVDHGGQAGGHAVAFMGFEGDACIIINPNAGRQIRSMDMIKEVWRGHAIEISRGASG